MKPFAPVALAAAALLLSALGPLAAQAHDAPGCWVRGDRADLELRASPYDSAAIALDAGTVKVCYSRPRKLGRPIMGRLVPYGEPWRLGADEATAIHVPVPAELAGVAVGPGWYSLYAVPGPEEWEIVVNAEARRWGVPINEDVRRRDLGSGTVAAEVVDGRVDLMTLRFEATGPAAADLVLEWDRTTVRIPVTLDPETDGG